MEYAHQRKRGLMRLAAKCLALAWAGVNMYFSLGHGYRAHMGLIETLRDTWWDGPLSLMTALIALGWDRLGGVLLVLLGLSWFVLFIWLIRTMEASWLLQIGPPAVAGTMLLLSAQRSGKDET